MNSKHILISYITLIGIMCVLFALWITPHSPGLSPDSIAYIEMAKGIFSGTGLGINTHFPPLYPVFIAATSLLSRNFVQAARFLDALLFGVNVGLAALMIYISAGRSILTTTFAVLLLAASKLIFELHAWALSEPLFIFLSLICIIFLAMYLRKPSLGFLIASSLSLGFAIITRFIGGAFLPAALVIILVREDGQKLSQRIRAALVWLFIACAPLVILSIRNMMMEGVATDRSFTFHPISVLSFIMKFLSVIFEFVAPGTLSRGIRLAIGGLLIASVIAPTIILLKRRLKNINWHSMKVLVPALCILFSILFLLFLFLSISFFDAYTSVDFRILSPVLFFFTIGIFAGTWSVSQKLRNPIIWWSFLIFVLFSISFKIPDSITYARDIHENGLGYTSKQWRDSQSIAFAKTFGEDITIYSNGADVLGFVAEKDVAYLPFKLDPLTTKSNPLYRNEIQRMCNEVIDNKALLVYLRLIDWRDFFPTQAELESTCQLPVLRNFEDGTVYGLK